MTDRLGRLFFFQALVLLALSFSGQVYAAKPIAQVYRVFGKVTQLRPGDLIARRVVAGDKIPVDTSIVTGKKSFAQILYFNGGSVNVGPKSKVLITQTAKRKQGVVGLLKGKIRSNYQDPSVRKSKNLKFFIRTKSAAMGVRGTDFQTIYNPENQVTNLLTFEGEVSMARIEPTFNKKSKKTRRKSARSKRRKVKQSIYRKSIDDVEVDIEIEEEEFSDKQIEEFIDNSDEVVNVKAGQFSGTLPALERASEPVKISPLQLSILKRNSGLAAKSKSSELKPYELDQVKMRAFAPQAKQEVPAEGYFDSDSGKFAPKAGGFIDVETGLYIQPSSHAIYDEGLGLYVENKLGTIDQETGQYIAPKGLKVHPTKGFVPKGKKYKKSTLAMAKNYNKEIQLDSLVNKKTSVSEMVNASLYSEQELYSKNILTFRYLTGSQSMTTTDDTVVTDATYESNSRSGYRIEWDIASNSNWRPYSYLEKQTVAIEVDNAAITKEAEDVLELAAGIKFYRSDRLGYFAQFGFDQNIMLLHPTPESSVLSNYDRLSRLKFLGGFDYTFVKSKRFDLRLIGFASFLPSSSKETLDLSTSFGLGGKLYFNYWLKRDIRLNLGLEYESTSMTLSYPTVEYTQSVSQMTPVFSLTKVF